MADMRGPEGDELAAEGEPQTIGDGYSADWTAGYGDVDEDFDYETQPDPLYGAGEASETNDDAAAEADAASDTADDDGSGIVDFFEDITGLDLTDSGDDEVSSLETSPLYAVDDGSEDMADDVSDHSEMGPDPHDAFAGTDPAEAFDIVD